VVARNDLPTPPGDAESPDVTAILCLADWDAFAFARHRTVGNEEPARWALLLALSRTQGLAYPIDVGGLANVPLQDLRIY